MSKRSLIHKDADQLSELIVGLWLRERRTCELPDTKVDVFVSDSDTHPSISTTIVREALENAVIRIRILEQLRGTDLTIGQIMDAISIIKSPGS